MEDYELITPSITAPGPTKNHENSSNVSSSLQLQEPTTTRTSKSSDFENSFELIDSPTTSSNVLPDVANLSKSKSVSIKEPSQENDDIEDSPNDNDKSFGKKNLSENLFYIYE